MEDTYDSKLKSTKAYASHYEGACGIGTSIFSFSERRYVQGAECGFCLSCKYAACGCCDYTNTHLYGCFEADRWNGLYIYYCPLSLSFTATAVYSGNKAELAIISGPLVIGSVEDLLGDFGEEIEAGMLSLPARSPKQVTDLAQTQWAMCMFLSCRESAVAERAMQGQSRMMNTLYDVSNEIRGMGQTRYPVEIEQKLRRMVSQGDKQGAREMINQLLGYVYFSSPEDFKAIRDKAKELVVLFSRASIEGGADVQKIFGQSRDIMAEINHFTQLDQLSDFLTSIFYRFVGYVFDFEQVEHADIIYKAINYVRGHYSEKLTLDDLSAHVFISKSYMSRIFREELGQSFTDYVNSVRVEKSKELLLETSLSIAEIAGMIGFSDQSYFTKIFSSNTGCSPGQYRRNRGVV